MNRLAAPLVLLALSSLTAANAAEHPLKPFFPGKDTCYARTYTPQHLKAHPKQRLRNIQIVHPFAAASSLENIDFRMGLRFQLKGNRDVFGAISVYCNGEADGTASCSVEGDGGRFKLSRGANNTLVMTLERLQLEGELDFSPDLAEGGDDRIIILHKAPMKACPKNKFED